MFSNADESCRERFELFTCSLYLPQCIVGDPDLKPCYHTLCLDAHQQCLYWLNQKNNNETAGAGVESGRKWPEALNCQLLFPQADQPRCFYPIPKSNFIADNNNNDDDNDDDDDNREKDGPIDGQSLNLSADHHVPIDLVGGHLEDDEVKWQGDDKTMPVTKKKTKVTKNEAMKWVKLNVGGETMMTTRTTLCDKTRQHSQVLMKMFKCDDDDDDDDVENKEAGLEKFVENGMEQGSINDYMALDRDLAYFRVIVNFLRTGKLIIDPNVSEQGVLQEAQFFNFRPLIRLIRRRMRKRKLEHFAI